MSASRPSSAIHESSSSLTLTLTKGGAFYAQCRGHLVVHWLAAFLSDGKALTLTLTLTLTTTLTITLTLALTRALTITLTLTLTLALTQTLFLRWQGAPAGAVEGGGGW